MMTDQDITEWVTNRFSKKGIRILSIDIKNFPGERILIAEVASQLQEAMAVAASMDGEIEDGFITVRLSQKRSSDLAHPVQSVNDVRVTRLIELLDTRSRTSEAQPSLRYIEDVDGRLQLAQSHRHQLIFGRRGAGKTALMLEAKKKVEERGAKTIWFNVQSVRTLGSLKAFLVVGTRLCETFESHFNGRNINVKSVDMARSLHAELHKISLRKRLKIDDLTPIIPRLQRLAFLFASESQTEIYLFLDDVHYLAYQEVPTFLDLVHGITRDCPFWIKVSGIKHQMKWFTNAPPTGLQLGHDAVEINLDITLQDPERANQFLQKVLNAYVEECDSKPRRAFLSSTAIDRLVLASGGVPRDFFTLCAAAIQVARKRPNARSAGVQDVNEAAGSAAKVKIEELEDDAAASLGGADQILTVLNRFRKFLLEDHKMVFFRIEFRNKEQNSESYATVQRLADLRMIHLINSSLSDPHQAGVRYEVYLLDLSEYSGSRLKRNLWVLDFQDGHMILKETGVKGDGILGDTSLKLVAILRRGPIFELSSIQ